MRSRSFVTGNLGLAVALRPVICAVITESWLARGPLAMLRDVVADPGSLARSGVVDIDLDGRGGEKLALGFAPGRVPR
jgi:hypothetical protein